MEQRRKQPGRFYMTEIQKPRANKGFEEQEAAGGQWERQLAFFKMLSTEDEGNHTQSTSCGRAEGKGPQPAGRQRGVGISHCRRVWGP